MEVGSRRWCSAPNPLSCCTPHDPEVAGRCGRVVTMRDGRIVGGPFDGRCGRVMGFRLGSRRLLLATTTTILVTLTGHQRVWRTDPGRPGGRAVGRARAPWILGGLGRLRHSGASQGGRVRCDRQSHGFGQPGFSRRSGDLRPIKWHRIRPGVKVWQRRWRSSAGWWPTRRRSGWTGHVGARPSGRGANDLVITTTARAWSSRTRVAVRHTGTDPVSSLPRWNRAVPDSRS